MKSSFIYEITYFQDKKYPRIIFLGMSIKYSTGIIIVNSVPLLL